MKHENIPLTSILSPRGEEKGLGRSPLRERGSIIQDKEKQDKLKFQFLIKL
jgi:hypothetical protein